MKRAQNDVDALRFVNSIRGRLMVAKALAYAIGTIETLPLERQEWSDAQDMKFILNECFAEWATHVADAVEHHTGKRPDLIDGKSGDYTPDQHPGFDSMVGAYIRSAQPDESTEGNS